MKDEYLVHCEADKAEAFRLLSELYHLPGPGVVARLTALESRMARACALAVPFVAGMGEHFTGGGDIQTLKIDFSQLFVGPFGMLAPPYGSAYLDSEKTVLGKSTLDALGRYKEEGLDISGSFHDAPDHIAAELEFIHFLAFKALEASARSDADLSARYLEKRQSFLTDHLGAWVPYFQRNVEEKAATGFYRNLAKATEAAIRQDLEELGRCAGTSGPAHTP